MTGEQREQFERFMTAFENWIRLEKEWEAIDGYDADASNLVNDAWDTMCAELATLRAITE